MYIVRSVQATLQYDLSSPVSTESKKNRMHICVCARGLRLRADPSVLFTAVGNPQPVY